MEPTVNATPTQEPMAAPAPEVVTPAAQAMPEQPTMATPMPVKKNSFGPLIGAVIIIAILIAGALYFWSPLLMPQQQGNTSYNPAADTTSDPIDATTQVSAATASVDALNGGSMEADLNTLSK